MPRRASFYAPRTLPLSTFVNIDLKSCDEEGRNITGRTWTWGFGTAAVVMAKWRRENPKLAAIEAGNVVVTAGPKKAVLAGPTPLGLRVEIEDRALARCAVGL